MIMYNSKDVFKEFELIDVGADFFRTKIDCRDEKRNEGCFVFRSDSSLMM